MLGVVLVNDQLDALFQYIYNLFHLSTCFEHTVLIIRRVGTYYSMKVTAWLPVGKELKFFPDRNQAVTFIE
jgi:hypothetical protein